MQLFDVAYGRELVAELPKIVNPPFLVVAPGTRLGGQFRTPRRTRRRAQSPSPERSRTP